MPLVINTFHAGGSVPSAIVNALHAELATIGFPVNGSEVFGTPTFGSATQARVRDFQTLYSIPATGDLDPVTGGIMFLASQVSTQADRNALKTALKGAIDKVPNSRDYNYWLARYCIMVGDYATPKTLIKLHPNLGAMVANLGSIFVPGIPAPQAPEVPYPENFYSYREDLIDRDRLAALVAGLDSLSLQDYNAFIAKSKSAPIDQPRFDSIVPIARFAVAAISAWQAANAYANDQELALAMQSYAECQSHVADYFQQVTGGSAAQRIEAALDIRRQNELSNAPFWQVLRWRRILLSLSELGDADRQKTLGDDPALNSAAAFVVTFTARDDLGTNQAAINQAKRLDPLLIIIATIWIPLAIGELNSQCRQFSAALQAFNNLLNAQARVDVRFRYLCEFIEIPFIRLLTLEALEAQADAEYKTGATVDSTTFPDAAIYHNLLAAKTYEDVLKKVGEDGHYVPNVSQARTALATSIQEAIQNKDTSSLAFRTLGKNITVPTISGVTAAPPGLDDTLGPHQSVAKIVSPNDPRTTNPRMYAIALFATAKLEQIRAGFNYLGYAPDYVPPWRFFFLLDRARYFAEHAKNAQRDYLNFLSNAEHEEFQEQSLSQTVEMEKVNIRLETARVDQAQDEVNASQASLTLASQQVTDAKSRLDDYLTFDSKMQELDLESSTLDGVSGGLALASGGPAAAAFGALTGFMKGIVGGQASELQRDLERENLSSSVTEATLAADVAAKKLQVDQDGLLVAGLQRQAAILRHEFAVQNLNFVRNQTLNADQWFRIANAIRSVSDTYLRYAIEMAFLAQQAYNFEADRRQNAIRFDYDLSDVGAMLAADFLLRDLDSLEQDLVVTQQVRLQQVRYVLSMAREFPETLADLAQTGTVTFNMRLEQLERRFPGMLNLRISSVEVQPFALLDATRFSLELTHLGTGMVRLKAQPGTSPLDSTDLSGESDWLSNVGTDWPVKIQTSGPETTVFSGLSRQEAASLGTITADERAAFEGLPGAGGWSIDMSMRGNRVVPNSLADILVTFTLSGYYDANLRDAEDRAAQRTLASTSSFSGNTDFADSFYHFNQTGRMDWNITPDLLALQGGIGKLKNLGVVLTLSQGRPDLGRLMCSYPIEFEVDAAGNVQILRNLPRIALTTNGLQLNATIPLGTNVTFDFGDGLDFGDNTALPHRYNRPGRYDVLIGLAENGRLTEYRAAVVVSQQFDVALPCIVVPDLHTSVAAGKITLAPSIQSVPGEAVSAIWRIDNFKPNQGSNPTTFTLDPGRYVLRFAAIRQLKARFYCRQRYVLSSIFPLDGLHLTTNRTFDGDTDTTTNLNPLGQEIFNGGILSPTDRWTLELPQDQNPHLMSVASNDVQQYDLGELSDAMLALEYDINER